MKLSSWANCKIAIIFTLAFFLPFATKVEAVELDNIIILASQQEAELKSSNQHVTVIDEKQLLAHSSLSEALSDVAGLDISSLGAPGEDINLRLRGSDKDEVLLLINGLPTNDALDSRATLLESIPLQIIQQIEIIRGPQSVLYGPNAVGGIINIVTKKSGNDKKIALSMGNYQHFGESALFSQKIKNNSVVLGFQRNDEKGRFQNDRYGAHSFFGSHLFENGTSKFYTHILYTLTNQDLAFENVIGGAIPLPIYTLRDTDRHLKRQYVIPQLSWEWQPNSWYESNLNYGLVWESINLENTNSLETVLVPGTARNSQLFDSSAQNHRVNWQNNLSLVQSKTLSSKLLAGAEFIFEKLKYTDGPVASDNTGLPTITYPDTSLNQKGTRTNFSGYLQNQTQLWQKITVTAGTRYDKNSTYGFSVSPRLSGSYENKTLATKFYSGFSMGFKAPTINEYYLTLTDTTGLQLRQKLATQKSQTIDVGFENKLIPKTIVGFDYFHTNYKNMVDDLALIPTAKIQGIDTWITTKPVNWLTISANYAYTLATNTATNTDLTSRPQHHFNTRIKWTPHKRLNITGSSQSVSSRLIPNTISTESLGDIPIEFFRENGTTFGQKLQNYTTLNVAINYDLPLKMKHVKKTTLSLKVTNLLNKSYSTNPGYLSRQFGIISGLSVNF